MTPDLLEAGARRLQEHQSRAQQEGQTESGGRSAGIGRVLRGQGPDFAHGVALYLDDISVSFDGFKALNALSLSIAVGELRCIIGPNGAGKTTMMDVITGKTRPDAGTAFFGSTIDPLNLRENEIAQAGIGRKFQTPTVYEPLSVLESLELSLKAECVALAECAAAGCASEEASSVCSRCQAVRYCSRECQRTDWMAHKPVCAAQTNVSADCVVHAVVQETSLTS